MRPAGHGNARTPGFGPLRAPVERANVIDWDAEEKKREIRIQGIKRRERLKKVITQGREADTTLRELKQEEQTVNIFIINTVCLVL